MNILGTICARGGSKGVKNKNIRDLAGKPLIAHTIEYFKQWEKADRVICSTDSEKIAEIAKKYGAEIPYMRPKELAADDTFKLDVLKHIVQFCEDEDGFEYDIIVDLDPTAPLRKRKYLDEAFNKFVKSNVNNLYSVTKARKNPYFNMVELDKKGYAHLCKKSDVVRRQDAAAVYEMNASIYIYKRDFLMKTNTLHSNKTIIYEMPDVASTDIDSETDFQYVEFLLKNEVFKFD
jgi:N-acylneuraminate cytidylyltransferase/CMP-N,N'-diacetyllegionaminic acid synthase